MKLPGVGSSQDVTNALGTGALYPPFGAATGMPWSHPSCSQNWPIGAHSPSPTRTHADESEHAARCRWLRWKVDLMEAGYFLWRSGWRLINKSSVQWNRRLVYYPFPGGKRRGVCGCVINEARAHLEVGFVMQRLHVISSLHKQKPQSADPQLLVSRKCRLCSEAFILKKCTVATTNVADSEMVTISTNFCMTTRDDDRRERRRDIT